MPVDDGSSREVKDGDKAAKILFLYLVLLKYISSLLVCKKGLHNRHISDISEV